MQVMQPFLAGSNPINAFNELDATIKNNTVTSAENMAVPSGAKVCLLISDADVWYSCAGTAAVPTDDSGSSSFLPADTEIGLAVETVSAINLISVSGTAHVAGRFWR